ncbi:MAG: hypothetical protein JST59_16490 [Actinobacteria bacterium]|nr:hypothetical protein [Actinomycetota bacterium]
MVRSAARMLALGALMILAASVSMPGTASAEATASGSHRIIRAHPVVPVLAESGGSLMGERQRRARVRIYAVRRGHGRRLVGQGRTGAAGVALVRLRTRRLPRSAVIVVGRGRLLGRRFGGHMVTRARLRPGKPVFVSPLSSLIAALRSAHPKLSQEAATRRVKTALALPSFFDFAGDLADRQIFDGRAFVRSARRHGGFDRFVRRRARHLRPAAVHASAVEADGCFAEASRTTAGFAELMGFRNVPNAPALPACAAPSPASSQASRRVATASGDSPLSIFGTAVSLAGLIYGVVSGQSTASELEEIRSQLNEVQSELQQIQADLGELQTEVAEVNANVVSGNMSTLIGDAVPTIDRIKSGGDEVMVLLGAAAQILCDKEKGCQVPAGTTNLTEALEVACEPETKACENFYTDLYFTSRTVSGYRPRVAVENLGSWAEGSAFTGAAPDPGIVQWALDQGAGDEQFFQTSNAADARLQWAYYTVYSTYSQLGYATALGMGLGQPLPGAHSAHPPKLTISVLREQVEKMDKPIGLQIAQFPNMPDSAVIDTNAEDPDRDPPSMFPQQVGAEVRISEYQREGALYELNGDVSSGSIRSSNQPGVSIRTWETHGEPPLVMTPAAAAGSETWSLLPTGGKPAQTPAMTSATFSDWALASGTSDAALPEWNSSTNKVDKTENPLTGPLPDLYGGAQPQGGQTAGQWMTESSGIRPALLSPTAAGFGEESGIVTEYGKTGDNDKDAGLGWGICTPGGSERCMLPTWQSQQIDPYSQVSSGQTYNSGSSQRNTGLFDLNSGLVIANQGLGSQPDPGTFVNQYPNWTNEINLRGVWFTGFLEIMNGTANRAVMELPGMSPLGRPVLFTRQQAANDCFFWTPSASGPAGGSGCLRQRSHSGEILP